MAAVSVYDLTDAQVDAIVTARRAQPEVVANIELNLVWDAARRRADRAAETRHLAALRRCTRCGIDTTAPDLCTDCLDLLAYEDEAS